MFNKTKAIELSVLSIIIFTLLLNLVNPIRIVNYEVKGYREINKENKENKEKSINALQRDINGDVDWEKVDYSPLCFGIKPDLFLSDYHALNHLSLLMIKISTVILLLLLYRKQLSIKISSKLAALLLFSFLIYSAVILYEVDYNFVFICEDIYYFETESVPINRN